MKAIELFPTEIFEFDLDPELLSDTLNKVRNLEWEKNTSNQISRNSLNLNPNFKNLHEYLSECLQKVNESQACNHLEFEKIVLTQSWANKSTKSQEHHKHGHDNSFLSGVVYLTSHESGFTYFLKKSDYANIFWQNNSELTYRYKPCAGKILIFPSSLFHGVEKMANDEERYSISFNSFPTGKIGCFTAGLVLETKQFLGSYGS